VHSAQQKFPDVLEADTILIFDDVPDGGIYFGDDLPWDADKGWVLVSDGNGVVIDFVPWGYSKEELDGLQVTIDGIIHEPGLRWKNAGLTAPGTRNAWHRTGDWNSFDPEQWTLASPNLGETDSQLRSPFAEIIPLAFPFVPTFRLTDGTWTESLITETPVYGSTFSASTTGESTAASGKFSITAAASPALALVDPIRAAEGQPVQQLRFPSPNDDTITFTARNLPQGLLLDPISGSIAGIVPPEGTYTFNLIAQNLAGATSIDIQLTSLKDTDRDGTPDAWELENGLDSQLADSGNDPDSDGATNLDEYLAGTDPHDSASVFRITRIAHTVENGLVEIDWRSVIGRRYSIEASTHLILWDKISDGTVTATTMNTSHSFFESGQSTRHYRVRVLP
jgi:hypothetical protein